MSRRRPTPLVMIHGAFGGGWCFDAFRAPFEAAYAVHAPNLRHHDGAQAPARALASTSLLDYLADMEKLIATFDEVPILLGHSMGGLLAQMLAAKGLAKALVLLAPSAPWGVLPTTLFEIAAVQALLAGGDYWNAPLAPNFAVAAAHALDKLPEDERRAVYARFCPESGRAAFEIMQWPFDLRCASRAPARHVTCPVLCLVGSEDKINPPSTVARIAARYDGRSRLEVLDGRSHWLIAEPGWEDVAGRALAWLGALQFGERKPEQTP
ncbi:MAG TPA: alpha/beta hydrolase [Rhizomicrobium sp.]|nr:alpha/beta hydrolase [Rhizomicrobium sp.]